MSCLPTPSRLRLKMIARLIHSVVVSLGLLVTAPVVLAAKPLVVSSKLSAESALIAQMIRLRAEAHGIPTVDRTVLAATPMMRRAIIAGEIDLYVEYTGNAAFFYNQTASADWRDSQLGFALGSQLDRQHHQLVWLKAAPANNRWALTIRDDWGRQYMLHTLSDLGQLMASPAGKQLKLACSAEFVNSDTLHALEQVYGLHFAASQLVILAGGETAAFMRAAARGIDNVNMAMVYSTDGAIHASHLTLLEDDQHVEPVYAPVPIVRQDALRRYPQLPSISDPILERLDTDTLQRLNARIQLEGVPITQVARDWLRQSHLLP